MLFDYGCDKNSGSNTKKSGCIISANPVKIVTRDTTTLIFISSNGDDNLSYLWESTAGKIDGTGKTVLWIAPGDMGIYTVTCVATNESEGEENGKIDITVFSLLDTTFMVNSKSGTSNYGGIGIFDSKVEVSGGDSLIILVSGGFYNGMVMVPDPNGFTNLVAENLPAMVMGISSNSCFVQCMTHFF